ARRRARRGAGFHQTHRRRAGVIQQTVAAFPARIPAADRRSSSLGVAAAALAVAATFGIRTLGWSGTDLAAQVYRVGLFKAHGWIPYDLGWYGGHSLLSYSTLFPPLARTIGMYGAAACSA